MLLNGKLMGSYWRSAIELSWEPKNSNHDDANPPITIESPVLEEESGLTYQVRFLWQ